MDNKTKESSVLDFTNLSLIELESQVVPLFPNEKNSEAVFHMDLLDVLSFRLICHGWEKEELLELFGEMIDSSIDTQTELEAEDEEQRKLITSVLDIKKQCLVLIEDQFTQQYHDVGDELYDLVERCEGDDGGDEIAKVTKEICERYLMEQSCSSSQKL